MQRILCVLLFVFVVNVMTVENNVCNKIEDYPRMQGNSDCWFNPDVNSTLRQLVNRHGHEFEIYELITPDGYILQLFRIPGAEGSQPVYIQHGILAASSIYLVNGNQSTPFVLSSAGYDVWLGNIRGSQFSRRHLKYSPNDSRFWDFSFHEMAIYDVPKALKWITGKTKRDDIIYIGHSMGTTMAYAYSSSMPEDAASKLKLIVALAPAIYMGNITETGRTLAQFSNILEAMAVGLGMNELGRNNPELYKFLCLNNEISTSICKLVFDLTFGTSPLQFHWEVLPVFFNFYPASASLKSFSHFAQMVRTNEFTMYDYGFLRNMAYYGSTQAPKYDLSRVKVPSFLMYSAGDVLATIPNAIRLNHTLENVVGTYQMKDENFGHLDFLIGRDISEVNNKILEVLDKYKS